MNGPDLMIGRKFLALNSNFRTETGLLNWINQACSSFFAKESISELGAINYTHANPVIPNTQDKHVFIHECEDAQQQAEAIIQTINKITNHKPTDHNNSDQTNLDHKNSDHKNLDHKNLDHKNSDQTN